MRLPVPASVSVCLTRAAANVLALQAESARSMPSPRDFFFGPWRAVAVLGVTQILSWGAIFYPPVMMVPLIMTERGFSFTFAMGGFSAGLLTAGLVSPAIGGMIDRYGGHRVMPLCLLARAFWLGWLGPGGPPPPH